MSFFSLAAAICLVVCHGGPADHFAAFAEHLPDVEIYAAGAALKKLEERNIAVTLPFCLEGLSAEEEDALAVKIAKACSKANVVMTDVGHPFDLKMQKALALQATHALRLAYYDNPEPYVPGGYSQVAAEVMLASEGILFANSTLAQERIFQTPDTPIDFGSRNKVGIGYYPLEQAEKVAKLRAEARPLLRQTLFQKNNLSEEGQKVLVYFGGNNEDYFSKALPAFLSLLEQGMNQSDCKHFVILLQQHPGAKAKNIDKNLWEAWANRSKKRPHAPCHAPCLLVSDLSSDEAGALADGALYYQTSMGPQFVLAGIPTLQVGHETYEDILVRNGLIPSVTRAEPLMEAIGNLSQKKVKPDVIFAGLGIKKDWLQRLEAALGSF